MDGTGKGLPCSPAMEQELGVHFGPYSEFRVRSTGLPWFSLKWEGCGSYGLPKLGGSRLLV